MEEADRLDDLIQRYLDGGVSAAEHVELDRFLAAHPQSAATFAEAVHFDQLLETCLTEQQKSAAVEKLVARFGAAETPADTPSTVAQGEGGRRQTVDGSDFRPPSTIYRLPSSRSTVLGFLRGLLHVGSDMPAAMALMWMVMAILCSGVILTIVLCVLLVYRGAGVNVHVDAPQVVQQPADLPSPPAVLGGGKGAGGEGSSNPSTLIPPPSATVARFVQAYDCHWAIGSHSPHPGDDLAPGRKLVLLSGMAEIMFESGVRAALQGPATMEVDSKMGAALLRGRLTVKVIDPDARGFEVRTPGMKYTDLGTEFGVFVAKDGSQEMHVFRGRVQALRCWDDMGLIPQLASPPLCLTANQAIRVVSPDKPMERIAAADRQFVFLPEPFPLFSTGVGLDRGASDPHWEITRISTDAPLYRENQLGNPQLAVVAVPLGSYAPDSRDKAQWISLGFPENKHGKILANMPGGCRWTLRTHFDLTGFDPATAQIEGRASVDDYLIEVRLNGKPMPLPAGARDRSRTLSGEWLPLKIEKGFAAGENVLEIVIENVVLPSSIRSMSNPMAFCVDWKGTARPTLKPSGD